MAFCPNCGAQVPDGRQFCAKCGAPMQAAAPAAPPPAAGGYAAPVPPQPQYAPMQNPQARQPVQTQTRRTSQRFQQTAQYGAQPPQAAGQPWPQSSGQQPAQAPAVDWERWQPRLRPAGATALIAAAALLLLGAVMLIWGASI